MKRDAAPWKSTLRLTPHPLAISFHAGLPSPEEAISSRTRRATASAEVSVVNGSGSLTQTVGGPA